MLQIYAGTLYITSGGGSENASMKTDSDPRSEPFPKTGAIEEGTSTKALKAVILILIEDGELVLDSSDDALHADGDIHIAGGSIEIASGDDGVHADDVLLVSGGELTITLSYEGLEATSITQTEVPCP